MLKSRTKTILFLWGIIGIITGAVKIREKIVWDSYLPEVQALYTFERNNGRCKLWLVESESNKTGWYPDEAMWSADLRKNYENSGNKTKLQKLKEDLESVENIKTRCSESKNEIILLKWNDNANSWTSEFPTREWDKFGKGKTDYQAPKLI